MSELLCFGLGMVAGSFSGLAAAFSLRHSKLANDLWRAPWRRKRGVFNEAMRRGDDW